VLQNLQGSREPERAGDGYNHIGDLNLRVFEIVASGATSAASIIKQVNARRII